MQKSVPFKGKSISYQCVGSGNTLVFLHGFIESKKIWDDFARELSPEFTVISIDLPGHGKSDVIAEIHTMELMADAVNEVLKQEKITNAVIVGHSMGGYTALEFGEKYPGKVIGMVLFHSQAAPDSDEAKENRRRTISIINQDRGRFILQFIPGLFDQQHVKDYSKQLSFLQAEAGSMSAKAIIAAVAGMRDRKGGITYLSETTKPVFFIVGKQDSRIPCKLILEQAILPAHSEVLLLDDVGHMGYIEAPRVTLQAVRHFAMRCFGE